MAREFDGPLSADDLAWLRSRYSESYVDRQVDLYGVADGAEDGTADAEEKAREAAEKAAQEAEEARAARQAQTGDAAAKDLEEDLIGGGDFNVLESTEGEVREWAATASDEDKAAALEAEQARGDREPRKGVVSLLS